VDFDVVDRLGPRVTSDDLSTNHGGVTVIAAADFVLSPIIIDRLQSTTFRLLCDGAGGRFAAIVVAP